MPLRNPNTPNPDIAILNILKSILPENTQLAASSLSGTGAELVYVQQKYAMSLALSQSTPIALLLSSGHQRYGRNSRSTFDGMLTIHARYAARWNDQSETIDDLWTTSVAPDLERMRANAESNDSLNYGQTNATISIADIDLSVYDNQYDHTFPSLAFIYREMTLIYNILPYGV